MGALIRQHDWSCTPLGPVDGWPSELRTAVGLMLGASQPVYVAYGPQLTSLYNDGYLPIVGTKHPAGLGAPFSVLWAEIWEAFKPIVEATMAGTAQHFVNLPIALGGRPGVPIGYFTFSYTALRDDAGRAVGFYCAATETTEQVLQATRLVENEEVLQHALSKGRGLGTWDWDVDPAWARAGAPIEEFFASVHPDDVQRLQDSVAEGLKSGAPFSAEYRLVQPDGSSRWVVAEGRCRLGPEGAPVRFLGLSFDITDQKAATVRREALAAVADAIRDVDDPDDLGFAAAGILGRTLDANRVSYGLVDPDSEVLAIQQGWLGSGVAPVPAVINLRDFGSFVDDLKRGADVVIHDVNLDPRTASAAQALSGRGVGAFVGATVLEQGRLAAMMYVVSARPRAWTRGELDLIKEVTERVRTATERLRAAEALRASHETLESRVEERSRALMATEDALRQSQKLEAIGQLTGGVAHDFNNLLTVIRGSVDMLRREGLSEERRRRYVDAIGDTANRATKLTAQLLAFARRQALRPETFEVGDSLDAVLNVVRSLTGSRIEMVREASPDTACWVRADRNQFDTAIVNMAVNARDAMDGEGRIGIGVSSVAGIPASEGHKAVAGDFVAVAISDSGTGIAPENLDKIFDPFFTTKEVGAGTGLGLSQVIGFAKQSDGEVRVESRLGGGSTFTLYLPRAEPLTAEAAADRVEHAGPGDGICVLVVEDNPQVGEFATHALMELGYNSVLAPNAAAALANLAEHPDRFHIVFSDVVMPGMSGLDLAYEIGRLYPDVPVILTSGYSHVLAESGSNDVDLLHKPYSIDQLSAALRGALARRR